MDKYKTLASNTMLISIGTLGSKLIVFFMVRFYTEFMKPSDYGTADLIIQTANLLLPLISFGITDGVFRFVMDHKRARKNIFTVGVWVITAGSLLFLAIVPLLRLSGTIGDYWILIVVFTMASCYHSLCAQFVRARGNTALYAGQGLLNTVLVVGLNVWFLAFLDLGITGYVLSVAAADIACTLFLIAKEKLWRELTSRPRRATFRQLLRYSIPLMPTSIFWWITSVSDRYMVTGFIGSDANGIYTVAYKIPTILIIVAGVFIEAWQFSAVDEADKDDAEHLRFFSNVWDSFQSLMFLTCGVMIALSQLEIMILSEASYFQAWKYVPLLSMAMIFSSFVTFMGSVYMVKMKSGLSFWTSMAGALLNIGLNLVLIPSPLGVQGAALATFASYFVVFLLRTISTRKLMPFDLHMKRLVVSTLILGAETAAVVTQMPYWELAAAAAVAGLAAVNIKMVLFSMKKLILIKKENSVRRRIKS
jgi:O-antigen/teichoic acid export membrane protein